MITKYNVHLLNNKDEQLEWLKDYKWEFLPKGKIKVYYDIMGPLGCKALKPWTREIFKFGTTKFKDCYDRVLYNHFMFLLGKEKNSFLNVHPEIFPGWSDWFDTERGEQVEENLLKVSEIYAIPKNKQIQTSGKTETRYYNYDYHKKMKNYLYKYKSK